MISLMSKIFSKSRHAKNPLRKKDSALKEAFVLTNNDIFHFTRDHKIQTSLNCTKAVKFRDNLKTKS